MKHIMTMAAAVACAFVLSACGGGGDGGGASAGTLSRADEGIWSNLNNGAATANNEDTWMQTVILSDGSYWGVYGQVLTNGFSLGGVLQGTAGVNGSSASGNYTDFGAGGVAVTGTYSGTASAQNTLNLTFNDPTNNLILMGGNSFNMGYDSIYNQPASLSAIAGNYLPSNGGINTGCGPDNINCSNNIYPQNMAISGSNLTLDDQNGNVIMTGTVTPHGTTVNVFDVSLTAAATAGPVVGLSPGGNTFTSGTIYKGILFETSSGLLKNNIEMVTTAGKSAFLYIGSKQS